MRCGAYTSGFHDNALLYGSHRVHVIACLITPCSATENLQAVLIPQRSLWLHGVQVGSDVAVYRFYNVFGNRSCQVQGHDLDQSASSPLQVIECYNTGKIVFTVVMECFAVWEQLYYQTLLQFFV